MEWRSFDAPVSRDNCEPALRNEGHEWCGLGSIYRTRTPSPGILQSNKVEPPASGLRRGVDGAISDREDSRYRPKHQGAHGQCAVVAHIAPQHHWRSSRTWAQQLVLFVELCCALTSKKERADAGALPQSNVAVSVCSPISLSVIALIW